MANAYEWDTVAANNNEPPPDGAPEGWNSTDVNNVIREIMARVRELMELMPWLELVRGETVSKVDDETFRISTGGNHTGVFIIGRQVQMIGSTTEYGRITNTAFSSPNTDVTVAVDGGADVPASLTAVPVAVLDFNANFALKSELSPDATVGEGPRENLIRDAGFEFADLTRWNLTNSTGGPWVLDVVNQRNGGQGIKYAAAGQTASAVLRGNSPEPASKTNQTPAQQDDFYLMRIHVKHTGTAPGGAFIQFGLEFRDDAGAVLSSAIADAVTATAGYLEHEFVTVAAPANTVYVVPFLQVNTGNPAGTVYHFDDLHLRRISDEPTTPSVVSAAEVTLPDEPDFIKVTGTTEITSVTASYAGRRVTLQFAAALAVINGSNLKLREDFAAAADRTLTLVSDGTDWWEVGRSEFVHPFDEVFTSPAQAFGNGVLIDLAHGLSAKPTLTQAFIINTTADGDYSPGDQLYLGSTPDSDASRGFQIYVEDDTNIKVKFTNQTNPIAIHRKGTGATYTVDRNDWDFFIRCWV